MLSFDQFLDFMDQLNNFPFPGGNIVFFKEAFHLRFRFQSKAEVLHSFLVPGKKQFRQGQDTQTTNAVLQGAVNRTLRQPLADREVYIFLYF